MIQSWMIYVFFVFDELRFFHTVIICFSFVQVKLFGGMAIFEKIQIIILHGNRMLNLVIFSFIDLQENPTA